MTSGQLGSCNANTMGPTRLATYDILSVSRFVPIIHKADVPALYASHFLLQSHSPDPQNEVSILALERLQYSFVGISDPKESQQLYNM